LLTVEHRCHGLGRRNVEYRTVEVVVAAVVPQESVELELLDRLGLDLPGKKAANRITAHERVKQRHDLIGLPYVLTLDRRENQLLSLDLAENRGDRRWR
jgi:hypothetical protein